MLRLGTACLWITVRRTMMFRDPPRAPPEKLTHCLSSRTSTKRHNTMSGRPKSLGTLWANVLRDSGSEEPLQPLTSALLEPESGQQPNRPAWSAHTIPARKRPQAAPRGPAQAALGVQ